MIPGLMNYLVLLVIAWQSCVGEPYDIDSAVRRMRAFKHPIHGKGSMK